MIISSRSQKVIDRWNLGGRVLRSACGCLIWLSVAGERRVFTCPDHRQPWEDPHPGFVRAPARVWSGYNPVS